MARISSNFYTSKMNDKISYFDFSQFLSKIISICICNFYDQNIVFHNENKICPLVRFTCNSE